MTDNYCEIDTDEAEGILRKKEETEQALQTLMAAIASRAVSLYFDTHEGKEAVKKANRLRRLLAEAEKIAVPVYESVDSAVARAVSSILEDQIATSSKRKQELEDSLPDLALAMAYARIEQLRISDLQEEDPDSQTKKEMADRKCKSARIAWSRAQDEYVLMCEIPDEGEADRTGETRKESAKLAFSMALRACKELEGGHWAIVVVYEAALLYYQMCNISLEFRARLALDKSSNGDSSLTEDKQLIVGEWKKLLVKLEELIKQLEQIDQVDLFNEATRLQEEIEIKRSAFEEKLTN